MPAALSTTASPGLVMFLRIMAAVFALFVVCFVALIIGWSLYRKHASRRTPPVGEDGSNAVPPEADSGESVIGFPDLAPKSPTLPAVRSMDDSEKLAATFTVTESFRMANNTPSVDKTSSKPFIPYRAPLQSSRSPNLKHARNGNDPQLQSIPPIKISIWARYIPRNPSPLGPYDRRGRVVIRGPAPTRSRSCKENTPKQHPMMKSRVFALRYAPA
ncbi:hypothetical protein CCMSSC00406_0005024 [Pleurotus cornucopiae]|uniref:Uncharacterized protein n=1 Tax=Pleurotus cornucopiae TaxID=5321 RepID=A0ACB7J8C4_PLECO|nr:hypothetical protein CCMSSC00406_0005024 [Pleurotus cornucopiae]